MKMINNAYVKLNKTIKRDIAKKVKELIKENKNNEYYELYIVYDRANNCFLVIDDYLKTHVDNYKLYNTVQYYKCNGIKTISEYVEEIF